ncbi:MAG: hypothetical protein ABFE07_18485 [Armatimonadia bacterium]
MPHDRRRVKPASTNPISKLARLTGRIVEEMRRLDRDIDAYDAPLQSKHFHDSRPGHPLNCVTAGSPVSTLRSKRIRLETSVCRALALLEEALPD